MTLPLDWIGGFFDADGSVGLSKRTRQRSDAVAFVPFVNFSQSDRDILDRIADQIGAKVYRHSAGGSVNSWGISVNRPSFMIRADNSKAIEIARRLIPVTHLKRNQLEEVVAFHDRFNNYTKGWCRWRHQNDEYDRRYAELVAAGDAVRQRLNQFRNKDLP